MATQWVITLATRTADDGRAAGELRGLLKVALRRFGLRCVSVSGGGDQGSAQGDLVGEWGKEGAVNN